MDENTTTKCAICKGPYHPSTGWRLGEHTALCGPCAKNFAKWYKNRMGRMSAKLKGMETSFADAAALSIVGE